ncbi:MAG: DUF4252 domain-containing protein [Bacteroidaceae bacterium]|nr:DUF4252 domain-containing protein [Bacteroidaceae bacterium]
MKKFVVMSLFFCLAVFQINAQNSIDKLFKDFSTAPGCESVNVGPFLMTLAKTFMSGELDFGKNINGVHIVDLANCTPKTKNRFSNRVKKVKDKQYELFTRVKDDGDNLSVWVKREKETINEFVLLSTGDSATLIRLRGNITQKDIDAVVKKYAK